MPAYPQPTRTPYLHRLVFEAVWAYDLSRQNDNLRRQVVTCFSRETKVTSFYLDALMPQIFEVVEDQMEVIAPNWGEYLTPDEAETAIHNGLIFTARVFKRYARRLPASAPIHPLALYENYSR